MRPLEVEFSVQGENFHNVLSCESDIVSSLHIIYCNPVGEKKIIPCKKIFTSDLYFVTRFEILISIFRLWNDGNV